MDCTKRRSSRIAVKSLSRFKNNADNPIAVNDSDDDFVHNHSHPLPKGLIHDVVYISSSSSKHPKRKRNDMIPKKDKKLDVSPSRRLTRSALKNSVNEVAVSGNDSAIVNRVGQLDLNPNILFPVITVRTTTRPLHETIHLLKDHQKDDVCAMGFKRLLDFSIVSILRRIAHFVVDSFCPNDMSIKVANGQIVVSPEKIHRILGIPIGGREVGIQRNEDIDRSPHNQWISRYGMKGVKPNDIKKSIIGQAGHDPLFQYEFLMLFVNCLIECSKTGECKSDVLKCLSKSEEIKGFDWCNFVFNKLKKCKEGWDASNPKSVFAGPLPILMLIYLDGTECNDLSINPKDFSLKACDFKSIKNRENYEISAAGFGKAVKLKPSLPLDVQNVFVGVAAREDHLSHIKPDAGHPNSSQNGSTSKPSAEEYHEALSRMRADLVAKKNQFEDLMSDAIGDYPEASFWMGFLDFFHQPEFHKAQEDDRPEFHPTELQSSKDVKEAETNTQSNISPNMESHNRNDDLKAHGDGQLHAPSACNVIETVEAGSADAIDQKRAQSPDSMFWSDPETLMIVESIERSAPRSDGRSRPRPYPFVFEADCVQTERLQVQCRLESIQKNVVISAIDEIQKAWHEPDCPVAPPYDHSDANQPSFSLGLSQDLTIPIIPIVEAQTVIPIAQDDPIDNILLPDRLNLVQRSNSSKRVQRISSNSAALRSPYVNRVVDIKKPTTKDENKIWDYVFESGENVMENMFVHECGIRVDRMQMQSMRPRGWVDEGVIDSWSMLLNNEELARNRNSPHRFFCPLSVTTSEMILNRELSLKQKAEMFMENLTSFLRTEELSIKSARMTYF